MKRNTEILNNLETIEMLVKKVREQVLELCDGEEKGTQQKSEGVPDPPPNPGGHGNG